MERPVPQGRQKSNSETQFSFVPSGLVGFEPHIPALKHWAIFTMSLRATEVEFPKGIRSNPYHAATHKPEPGTPTQW